MAWQETLMKLREELREVRAERHHQAVEEEAQRQQQRRHLSELAASLDISSMLAELNRVLLDGKGEIETLSSWGDDGDDTELEDDDLDFDDEEDEEDVDAITSILSWEEDGEREIAVDLDLAEEGFYLHVNRVDIRPERDALERALVEAFRDELEL